MPKDLNLEDVVQAVEDSNKAFEEFKTEMDKVIEKKAGESVDVLTKEKLGKIEETLDASQKKIDDLYVAQKRKHVQLNGKEVSEEELNAKSFAWARVASEFRNGKNRPESFTHEQVQDYKSGFFKWMAEGKEGLEPEEVKALSVGSDPDGGYVVDPDTTGRIVSRLFGTSPVRAFASVQMISTDALEGMHDIDEATVGWVGEKGSRTETDTPEMDIWRIPVHEQYAEPRATQKILDDAFIDIETWLANKVADKMTRTENTAFVNGNGVNKPRGFLTYGDWATAGTFELGAIEQFDTGANGAFASDPNGPDVLYDAIYGLKSVYRQGANWFANRSTYGALRKMQDSNGMYMWQPSVQAGEPAMLAGYPTASFEDMPDFSTTGNLALAFGNLAEAYQIVDRMGIRVLRDPYTAKPYVKFYTTKRVGGDVVNFEALKLIAFQA